LQFNDEILVQETLAGSHAAYERLVARYEKLVFKVAWSYARHRDGALDVCQEVFVKAYRKLDSIRGGGSFKAWLMRIAHRESVNWLRGNRRYLEMTGLEEAADPACGPDQENALLADETRRGLLDRLGRLNPRQREALTMRYFDRAPVREIAEALGCSEGVARNILFRGLAKMRAEMTSSGRET